jgi:hypothetical protein
MTYVSSTAEIKHAGCLISGVTLYKCLQKENVRRMLASNLLSSKQQIEIPAFTRKPWVWI